MEFFQVITNQFSPTFPEEDLWTGPQKNETRC